MMSRFGWLRPRVILGMVGVLVLAGVLGAMGYFLVENLPLLYGRPVVRPPVSWTSLPVPVVEHGGWESYSSVDSVRDVVVTADFLWIATDGGLVVYDRVLERQVVFKSEHGLPSNRLTAVALAADGRVWVGAESGGVGVYDGRVWTRFLMEDGLPSNSVADVVVDGDGIVWAATDAGIGRYDGNGWQWVRPSLLDFSRVTVRDLAVGNSGLWAATENGLWHFDGRAWQTFTNRDGMVSDHLFSVTVGVDGSVWAGGDRGLSRFDGGRFVRFAAAEGIIEEPIVSLVGETDGSVWLVYGGGGQEMVNFDGVVVRGEDGEELGELRGVENTAEGIWASGAQGLGRFVNGDWEIVALESEILSNEIGEIAERDGVLWLAMDGGIQTFDGNGWGGYTAEDGLQDAAVQALDITLDGEIVVGYERPRDGIGVWQDGAWMTQLCVHAGVDIGRVFGGTVGPDGDVWFLGESGVGRYDGRVWVKYTAGWPQDALPHYVDIAPDGTAWVALREGLYRWDESGRWVQERNEDVFRFSIAPNGGMWFATPTGLYHRQGGQDVNVATPAVNGLQGFLVTDEHVWLSDQDGVLQLTDDGWVRYTTAEGLASNSVTALTLAPDGRVWAAYEAAGLGFTVFDGEAWQVLHNSQGIESDGLASDQVNDVLATPDGLIWFATNDGLSQYDLSSRAWGTIARGTPILQVVYAHGDVWVRTESMTARVSGTSLRQTEMMFSQADYLAVAPDGVLWAAVMGESGQFHQFDGDGWGGTRLPDGVTAVVDMAFEPAGRPWLIGVLSDGDNGLFFYQDGVWQQSILPVTDPLVDLEIDGAGRLWLSGSEEAGATVWGADEAAVLTLIDTIPLLEAAALENLSISVSGEVWGAALGAEDMVLGRWLDGSWQVSAVPIPLQGIGTVSKIEVAPNGVVWLSTAAGAVRYVDGVWESVRYEPRQSGPHGMILDGPPRDPVNHIAVTETGSVWFGSSLGQVGQVQAGSMLYTPEQRLATDAITAVLVEPSGAVWVSNISGRMYRFEGEEWVLYDRTLDMADVQTIVGTESAVWLGTDEGVVQLTADQCRLIENQQRDLFEVNDGLLDDDGNLWWGTGNQGAVQYDTAVGEYDWPELSLRGRNIQAMAADLNGGLWFYYEGVLSHYRNGRLLETIRVGSQITEDVLAPFEVVTALAIDANQRPWLGTERGVVTPVGSLTGDVWGRLTAADGLADNQVREVLQSADGTLWFVTEGGVSRYRP